MIRALTKTFVAVAALVGLAGTANASFVAASWTDSVAGSSTLINSSKDFSYTHDLTDNGFRPLTDLITDFSLSLNLSDDKDAAGEWATINVADVFGLGNKYTFNISDTNFTHGTTLLGLIELNVLGTLSVTIHAIQTGDFYFGGSKLVAAGLQDTRQVPEPETLAMFGIGLVGVAAAARRRKAKNA
jgi:hypothetical protein